MALRLKRWRKCGIFGFRSDNSALYYLDRKVVSNALNLLLIKITEQELYNINKKINIRQSHFLQKNIYKEVKYSCELLIFFLEMFYYNVKRSSNSIHDVLIKLFKLKSFFVDRINPYIIKPSPGIKHHIFYPKVGKTYTVTYFSHVKYLNLLQK